MSNPETPGHEPSQFVALPDRALAVQALRALCFSPSDATRLAAAKLLLEHSAAPVAPVVPLHAAPAAGEEPKLRTPRQVILDILLDATDRPLDAKALAAISGISVGDVGDELVTLVDSGRVRQILTRGDAGTEWPTVYIAAGHE